MPGYRTKQETIAIAGVADLVIRSLLDRQQFADADGAAERLGISSAAGRCSACPGLRVRNSRPGSARGRSLPEKESSRSAAASPWRAWSAIAAAPT